jgi:hypothetical protein
MRVSAGFQWAPYSPMRVSAGFQWAPQIRCHDPTSVCLSVGRSPSKLEFLFFSMRVTGVVAVARSGSQKMEHSSAWRGAPLVRSKMGKCNRCPDETENPPVKSSYRYDAQYIIKRPRWLHCRDQQPCQGPTLSTVQHCAALGCWEAFCGTGRALPVPVSDSYIGLYGPQIAKCSPASAGLNSAISG